MIFDISEFPESKCAFLRNCRCVCMCEREGACVTVYVCVRAKAITFGPFHRFSSDKAHLFSLFRRIF